MDDNCALLFSVAACVLLTQNSFCLFELIPSYYSQLAVAYVNELPPEIFGGIFAIVLGNYWCNIRRYTKDRFVLAHICSQWRAVMLEYQMLWNSITLSVNVPRDWIEFYLRRVLATPLSLHMTLY